MTFKFELDPEFEQKIQNIAKPQQVELQNLLTDNFLTSYTNFSNIDELLKSLNISTYEDLQNYPKEKLNNFINNHTSFETWDELLQQASTEYLISQIEL